MSTGVPLRLPNATRQGRAGRMLAVLRAVHAHGDVSVAALTAELGVSAATLRRDLAELADQGLLVRTHGGARPRSAEDETPVHLRSTVAQEAKLRVGVRAAELIPQGPHTVALSGGTTTAETARALARRPSLTLLTNALPIAVEAAAHPGCTVVMAGGIVRGTSLESVGVLAENTFRAVRIGTAVLGAAGVSVEGGVTTYNDVEARANREMAEAADRVVVVVDGSKLGRVTPARIVDLDRVDVLVTDTDADTGALTRIRQAGVAVELVGPRR